MRHIQQHKGMLCTVKRDGGCIVQMSHTGVPLMKSPPCQTMLIPAQCRTVWAHRPWHYPFIVCIQQSWWWMSERRRGAPLRTCCILSSSLAMTTSWDLEAPVRRKSLQNGLPIFHFIMQHPWSVNVEGWHKKMEGIKPYAQLWACKDCIWTS